MKLVDAVQFFGCSLLALGCLAVAAPAQAQTQTPTPIPLGVLKPGDKRCTMPGANPVPGQAVLIEVEVLPLADADPLSLPTEPAILEVILFDNFNRIVFLTAPLRPSALPSLTKFVVGSLNGFESQIASNLSIAACVSLPEDYPASLRLAGRATVVPDR